MRLPRLVFVLGCLSLLLPQDAMAGRWGWKRCGTRRARARCCRVVTPCQATAAVAPQSSAETPSTAAAPKKVEPIDPWQNLFNGKDLTGWEITKFGGEGDVDVEEGVLRLGFGQYLTGVTSTAKDLPTNNYEIELEAMREEGFDFFCCLTFPVDESHCSFVVGGWGGSVTGISSIDDMDASENETTSFMLFEPKKWYKIRLRVTPGKIEAWINDKEMVNQEVTDRKLSTRIEVDLSIPLGIASFDTQAALRNIRMRALPPAK